MGTRLISWRGLSALVMVVLLSGLLTAGSAFAATRYEQSDPSVVYTGVWTPSVLPGHSGGSVEYSSDQANGTATFSFTGTGVDYIAAKWYNRGIAAVSLDGGPEQLLDLYAPGIPGDTTTVQYQQVIYSVRALANGPHTLKVRVTGTRSGAAAAPGLITVDAFDVFVEPPVVSTSASSLWSLAVLGLVGVGVAAVVLKRRAVS